MANANLNAARQAKDDEFFTLYEDVEDFLEYYGNNEYFKDKIVHLPCDNEHSNFYKYLKDNYNNFKIKEIIATAYDPNGGKITTYKDGQEKIEQVKESMSYLEKESQEISLRADFVMSNPPFSSFGEYVPFLVNNNKSFIFLTSLTKISNVTFSEISAQVGSKYYYYGMNLKFLRPDNSLSGVPVMWVTNIKNNSKTIRKLSDSKPFDLVINMRTPDGEPIYSCSNVKQLNNPIPGGKYVLAPITLMTYDFHDSFDFVGFTNHGNVFNDWYTDDELKKRPYVKNEDDELSELYTRVVLKIKGR